LHAGGVRNGLETRDRVADVPRAVCDERRPLNARHRRSSARALTEARVARRARGRGRTHGFLSLLASPSLRRPVHVPAKRAPPPRPRPGRAAARRPREQPPWAPPPARPRTAA